MNHLACKNAISVILSARTAMDLVILIASSAQVHTSLSKLNKDVLLWMAALTATMKIKTKNVSHATSTV